MRYFLQLMYDGTDYHGWQIQDNADTVQHRINEALSTILREPVLVVGCGRTDAGVHAKDFYAHFDCKHRLVKKTIFQLNSILAKDIAIIDLFEVNSDANARFDAISRTYFYQIHSKKDPFQNRRSHYFSKELDINAMNLASKLLLGEQNFKCFSKSKTQVHTYLCNVMKANWIKEDGGYRFEITANRFLRNMVRAIVGTTIEAGLGVLTLEELKIILLSQDRGRAGTSVPAMGLYLADITYDWGKIRVS